MVLFAWMQTVLFASELGGGFGHIARLLRVARALAMRNFRPLFVVRDPVEVFPALAPHGYPVFQAPDLLPRHRRESGPESAGSFADVLEAVGFGEPARLRPALEVWRSLLELARPALVVADYAPSLCLATLGGPPTVVVGSGFTLPPPQLAGFPPLVEGKTSVADEAALLASVAAVQHSRGRPAPLALPALLRPEAHFVVSVPELDPYARWRLPAARGGLLDLPAAAETRRRSVFAYLAAEAPITARVLRALGRTGIEARAYVRNRHRLPPGGPREGGVVLEPEPTPLGNALAEAGVIVHHGGSGTAHQALLAGRPQVIVPCHLEQTLTARALERLGVAITLGDAEMPLMERKLTEAVHDDGWAARAAALGAELRSREQPSRLDQLVDLCLAAR
jgi:rhamnosyltransferase subunit B